MREANPVTRATFKRNLALYAGWGAPENYDRLLSEFDRLKAIEAAAMALDKCFPAKLDGSGWYEQEKELRKLLEAKP